MGERKGAKDRSRSRSKSARKDSGKKVDRVTTTPSLLRIFYKFGKHHQVRDFGVRGRESTDEELQVYIWPDTTMAELVDLVQDVLPDARGEQLHFNLIYPDKTGKMVFFEIGRAGEGGPEDQR